MSLQEAVAISEDQLPLTLPPTQDFVPSGRAESPLAKITDWVHTTDPTTGVTSEIMPCIAHCVLVVGPFATLVLSFAGQ